MEEEERGGTRGSGVGDCCGFGGWVDGGGGWIGVDGVFGGCGEDGRVWARGKR